MACHDTGHCTLTAMQAVHELYSLGGAAVEPVGTAFPGCLVDGGKDNLNTGQRNAATHGLDLVDWSCSHKPAFVGSFCGGQRGNIC